jgi:hypothetical protein
MFVLLCFLKKMGPDWNVENEWRQSKTGFKNVAETWV